MGKHYAYLCITHIPVNFLIFYVLWFLCTLCTFFNFIILISPLCLEIFKTPKFGLYNYIICIIVVAVVKIWSYATGHSPFYYVHYTHNRHTYTGYRILNRNYNRTRWPMYSIINQSFRLWFTGRKRLRRVRWRVRRRWKRRERGAHRGFIFGRGRTGCPRPSRLPGRRTPNRRISVQAQPAAGRDGAKPAE